jgi:cytochrome b6
VNALPEERPPGPVKVRLWRAVDERYRLGALVDFLRHKEVPRGGHWTIWYYFGGVALFFFLVQIATGILLLMYYQVGEATSYESMKLLVGRVPFGWLIRSIHCWSAHLMCLAMVVHLCSVAFTKAYRKPREMTWFTGCVLLALALGFGFSGYLLPWNELSYFATAVGTDSVKSIPGVGPWMLRVLRGGDEVSGQTLYRFFALHVCILPLVIFGAVGFHLLLVQRQGMADSLEPVPESRRRRGLPFFPNFALRDVLFWVVCLNVLAILAVLLPYGPGIPGMEWELGHKADPLKPAYPGIRPEWYFLWIFQMLREFPAHLFGLEGPQVCLLLVNVLLIGFVALPVLDRRAARGEPSPAFTDIVLAALLFVGMLTFKAWDVGVKVPHGTDPAASPVLLHTIARTAALLTIAIGLVVNAARWARHRRTTFVFSGAVLLQAVLHGFFGMSWLAATGVSAALLAALLVFRVFRGGARDATAVLLLAGALSALSLAHPARAEEDASGHVPEAQWPKDFTAFFTSRAKDQPVLDEKAQARFRALPGHAQTLFFASVKSGMVGSAAHLATLLALDVDNKKMELVVADNCVVCHTNPDLPDQILFRARPDKKDPFKHLEIRDVVSDTHFRRGLMCSGCHGGKPTDTEMSPEISARWPSEDARKKDRSWIPDFCARCHASSEFMRGFNPSLPVDQLAKYRTSKHGHLLLEKHDSKAAQCVSCHGVHGILGPDSPRSTVYAANVPATCGRCHADPAYMKGYTLEDGTTPLPTNQLELYKKSVHGNAVLVKHEKGAPACNNCHGNHAALPPEIAHISQVCRHCHAANGALFDGSPHKKAFEEHRWPECATCHGYHGIAKPSDDMLAKGPKSACADCHAKYGKPICDETAAFFHASIVRLRTAGTDLDVSIDRLGERGFDLDELRFQAAAASDALRKTRLAIHSFDRSDFSESGKSADKELAALRASVDRLGAEYRYRRRGLLFSTALISLFGILLYGKIRQADRDKGLGK